MSYWIEDHSNIPVGMFFPSLDNMMVCLFSVAISPRLIMVNELMGWSWSFAAMPYGDDWRERRRLFTKYFHPNNPSANIPQQLEFVHKMLMQLLNDPDDFLHVIQRYFTSK